MNQVKVIVDQRERNVELLDSLCELGIESSIDTLDIGDYLISDRLCI